MTLFLLIVLFVLAIGAYPGWRPAENRTLYGGYYPSTGLVLLFVILVALVLTGHIRV